MRRTFAILSIVCSLLLLPACQKELSPPEISKSATQLHRLSGNEEIKDAIVLKNGNSVLVGGKLDDAFIVMFNPNNEIVWSREIAKSGTDAFFTVVEMPNGDIVAAGHTNSREYSTDRLSTDILLVKYSANGDKIFDQVFGTEYDDKPNDIIVDKNGDILIVGFVHNHIIRTAAYKLRPDGKLIWKNSYQFGPYFNEAKAICELDNGSYLIAGLQSKSNLRVEIRSYLTFTFSLDQNGDVQSYYPYLGYVRSDLMIKEWAPMDLIKTPSGYFVSSFYYDISQTEPPCVQLLELGPNFSVANEKRFYGVGSFKPFKIYPQSDGYLLAGASSTGLTIDAYGFSQSFGTVIHLNSELEINWSSYVGSAGLLQETYAAGIYDSRLSVQGSSINLFNQSANLLSYFLQAINGELIDETK